MARLEEQHFGLYYPTYFFPTSALSRNSWTTITYHDEEAREFARIEESRVDAGVRRNWLLGLFGVRAGGESSSNEERVSCSSGSVRVSFEVMQIPLVRPWFDASVLSSRAWRWAGGDATPVSDGENPPHGRMPAYASSVLVARNLSIVATFSEDECERLQRSIEGGASISFGIFSLGGNGLSSSSSSEHRSHLTENGISCPGMQIIGFLCKALPKCPDPDETLIWR